MQSNPPCSIYLTGDKMNCLIITKLKNYLLFVVTLFFGMLLFLFSTDLRIGITDGISLCLNSVIPSLFLFTVLAIFIYESRLLSGVGIFLQPVSQKVFRLNGQQTTVLLLSLVSGYPIGAKLLNEMYIKKEIDIKTAKIMLLYCVNAGPAFIVTAIGQSVLGSTSDGQRLLLAHVLSTVLMAFVFGRLLPKSPPLTRLNNSKIAAVQIFVSSVTSAAKSMLGICAFVVMFSGICNTIINLKLPQKVAKAMCSVLEVTVGLQGQTRNHLAQIAFLLGFGGLSVIFQIMTSAKDVKPNLFNLILSRVLHGTFSALLIKLFEAISPRALKTMSAGQPIINATVTTNPIAAVSLVFLSVTLIFFVGSGKIYKSTVEN